MESCVGARQRRGFDLECFAVVFVVSGSADEVENCTLGSGAGISGAGGAGSVVPDETSWYSVSGSGSVPAACAAKMEESWRRA